MLEESVSSAFRTVEVHCYPDDGGSTYLSFRQRHEAACQQITVIITTVVISNDKYSVHLKLLGVLGTLQM
jgi:hypothetical protein